MALEHEVMTHLDIEDRPFFGLTVRQFAILFAAAFIAMFLYSFALAWLDDIPRLIVTGLVMLPVTAAVLIKPEGKPLTEWLLDRVFFALQSNVAIFGLREMQEELHEVEVHYRADSSSGQLPPA